MGNMSTVIKRRSVLSVMLAALVFAGTLVAPGAAHAIGMVWLSQYQAQADEALTIAPGYSDSYCPVGYSSDVFAQLIDDEQSVFETKIGTSNSNNGSWSPGALTIPKEASVGSATIRVVCKSGFGNTTASFDQSITIFSPANEITVDRAQFGMTSTFSSLPGKGCGPNEDVVAEIYSTVPNSSGIGMTVVESLQGVPDSSGNWTLQVQVDNTDFDANKHYFLQASCTNAGIMYYSFKFTPRWNEYVALGDSYSSGEGSFNYDLAGGGCHRSTDSYPHYLVDNLSLDAPDFQACSGAVTSDLYFPNPNRPGELAQLEPINGYTQKVTLTIGGNDIGFSAIAKECANFANHSGYSCGTSGRTNEASDRIAALDGVDTTPGDGQMIKTPEGRPIFPIKTILSNIATAAPSAKIYIAGYPQLFGENSAYYDEYDGDAPGAYLCHAGMVKYSLGDAGVMNNIGESLNQVISDAVDELNDPDIEYVSPSNFNGHGLCDSGTSWLNDIGMDSTFHLHKESLHPTVAGMQQGYGAAFAYEMTN